MSSPSTVQHSRPPSAATVAEGVGKARPIQGSARQLQLCKELFFAGFPCQRPYQRSGNSSTSTVTSSSSAADTASTTQVRPLSKMFIRGFFQQYGVVESLFYDEARGMGSVVFADGADAEGCYVAVHLSFLPATTAEGGIGQPTWTQDQQGEDMAERKARPDDWLLCLEFAHCCPFVNTVLLTKDVFVDGGLAHCEVPGGELSRAILFHRFPQLLWPSSPAGTAAAGAASRPMVPVAPHIVVRWQEEGEGEGEGIEGCTDHRSRVVEVLDDEHAGGDKGNEPGTVPSAKDVQQSRRTRQVGPNFPGRPIEPVEVELALWQLLRPSHIPPAPGSVVTVLDLWWEYYNLYMLHKTQPAESRITQAAFRYAQRPSLLQELLNVQRQGREYAHGDEAAAQQVLQRLVYDNQYHNVLTYLTVKAKFKYDPVWASLMRDLYKPKLTLKVEAWQALMEQDEADAAKKRGEAETTVPDSEVRRRRVVMKAINELHEPQPTKPRDVAWVQQAEQTWLTMPRTTATYNVMENVKLLNKVKRGEVDRSGHDKEVRSPPPPSTQNSQQGEGAEEAEAVKDVNIEAAYPSMSSRQKEEQFYAEVMQNLDGYVATGTAEELVAMCEDPKLFRYAKGHIGYEEAHRQPSYWLTYLNALWVPLIAFLLLGFGSYYIVDRLGISKINEIQRQEQLKREFHDQLRHLLEQQQRLLNVSLETNNTQDRRAALKAMDDTRRRASEAARRAGGKFNIELRGDL
jgi:hypothetical protein